MWCTRWYLPLVILPLPIAPPYFLVLFLFSTTLHAKPCFYCIILMTAMFLSSCYWPPAPINTALSTPWSDNITTFAEALLSRMPELPSSMVPSEIPIVDHCWCDLTSGSIFEPYNMTKWEVDSVERLKARLETQLKEIAKEGTNETTVPIDQTAQHSNPVSEPGLTWDSIWDAVWPFASRSGEPKEKTPATTSVVKEPLLLSNYTVTRRGLSLLRKEYDLRPYGFDLVVDFGWSRSTS
ncbi:hypothetical protein C8Q75DRAFT_874003 [Abortiporus biennis]|nr:hypothetical protein C8Q75DRAFT_874003 [Abortiporus biennis]